jgi:catechol 2,3-dioxygenase-like lactoylglutathione lyase family enzyme
MNLLHHHVGLSVADLGRAKKWYADVLGMTEGFAFELPQFGVRGCFMEGHGTRVELFERVGSGGGIGGQLPPEALLARGAKPVWDPRPSPEPGVRMAFVADDDGNLVELVSERRSAVPRCTEERGSLRPSDEGNAAPQGAPEPSEP